MCNRALVETHVKSWLNFTSRILQFEFYILDRMTLTHSSVLKAPCVMAGAAGEPFSIWPS